MSKFLPLFDSPTEAVPTPTPKNKSRPTPKDDKPRGCEVCPANKVKGLHKILGTVEGKAIALFAQSPGLDENDARQELVGASGKWLWKELGKVGIKREDCDIQNAGMRCTPVDVIESTYNTHFKLRDPSKEELRCCSIHTDRALEKLKAKQVIIFGKVAAKQILGRSLPDSKIFYSDQLKAKVYLLDHPSYFVRGYAPPSRLQAFRDTLKLIAEERGKKVEKLSDDYGYIRKQDYRLVLTGRQADEADEIIREHVAKGLRVSFDVEDDEYDDGRHITCVGFCPKPGLSFVFVFRREEDYNNPGVRVVAKNLLEDHTVKKAAHYGCSDTLKLEALEGIKVQGFDHDTNQSEYLRFSDLYEYGLDKIAERRFPKFSGYGNIILKEMLEDLPDVPTRVLNGTPTQKYDYLNKNKLFSIRKLSLDTLRLYNGADCDLTKRIEVSNKKHVPQALLNLYIDLSYILYKMEPNGPLFDYEQNEKLTQLYPYLVEEGRKELQKIAKDPEFNPGSPQQVYKLLFETLGLTYPLDGEPNTQKNTLLTMARKNPIPKKVVVWRANAKVESTYLKSYKTCADLNGGRLRTTWWGTGARTGRLRSGGGGKNKRPEIVNLQNIHNDPHIKNQCISDVRWRKLYRVIEKALEMHEEDVAAKKVLTWVKKHMPDIRVYLIDDYGQVEVRVFAEMSGDENLRADCEKEDIHTAVGTTLTGWEAEKISNDKATRTVTKNCVAEGQRLLTNRGLVPIEKLDKSMLVWDGIEFVSHEGLIYQGIREVMKYDGLTATKDHEVWTYDGTKIRLEEAEEYSLRLAVTGVEGNPVRYTHDNFCGNPSEGSVSCGIHSMQRMPRDTPSFSGCHSQRDITELQVPTQQKISRPASQSLTGTLLGHKTAMRESQEPELEKLRSKGDSEQVHISRGICGLYVEACTPSDIQGSRDRSEGQQWSLSTRESTASYTSRKLLEQDNQYLSRLQRTTDVCNGSSTEDENRLSSDDSSSSGGCTTATVGSSLEATNQSEGERALWQTKVYDVLNAGPRRRFTVEGHLVSNCHFGILFGSELEGVYNFVVARTPEDMEPWTRDQVEIGMKRYFRRYTKVKPFFQKMQDFGEEHGYVETIFGMRQRLNVGSGEQEDYGGDEDGGREHGFWKNQCVDFETEALTQRGWLKGTAIKPGDVILTKNIKTGWLEWQSASAINLYPDYSGKIWTFKSRSFSAVTTPNHRWMVTRRGHSGKPGRRLCITSNKLSFHGDDRIHRTGRYIGPAASSYSDDLIRLLGWVCTDGYLLRQGRGWGANSVQVMQSLRAKPYYVKIIDKLFLRLGISVRRKVVKDSECVYWSFSGRFGALIHSLIPGRTLQPQFLTSLTKRQLRLLYTSMVRGDGSSRELLNGKGLTHQSETHRASFTAASKSRADMFQMLCVLLGRSSSSRYEDLSEYIPTASPYINNEIKSDGVYRVRVHERKRAQILARQVQVSTGHLGMWCPTVPNGFFVARRKGQVYITGNSINGPIQGSAHQLLICGLVNMRRQPEKYKVLGEVPVLDVHDNLTDSIRLLDLPEAVKKSRYLMEHESLNTVKKDFPHIDWHVPIVVEATAGFSLGCEVEVNEKTDIGEFLISWYKKRKKQEDELEAKLSKVLHN